MAVDREMLDAMRAMMKEELEPINARLDTIDAGQAVLQEDVAQIKTVASKIDHEVIPHLNSLYDGYKWI